MFEYTLSVTYFHRVIDIKCMRSYLVYQTLNIIFCVVRSQLIEISKRSVENETLGRK